MKQARQDQFISRWEEYAKGTALEAILSDFYPLLYFYYPKKEYPQLKKTYQEKSQFSMPDEGSPFGVAISPIGQIFISDDRLSCVQVFSKNGDHLRCFSGLGGGDGQLNTPCGCIFNLDGNFVVADKVNGRVQIFNQKGEFLSKFGCVSGWELDHHTPLYGLKNPYCVAEDHDGNYLVSSFNHHRIVVFNPDGIALKYFGGQGSKLGEMDGPVGVVVDSMGNIIISECTSPPFQKQLDRLHLVVPFWNQLPLGLLHVFLANPPGLFVA